MADGSGARDHDDYERDLEPVIREHVHEADRKIQRGIRVRFDFGFVWVDCGFGGSFHWR